MMNERRRKRQILKVDHYDGQTIYSGRELYYELGGYLGGGAAGVVYEAFCARTKRHVAIKILNPVGYKLLPSSLLSRCIVAVRGKPLEATNANAHDDDEEYDDDELGGGGDHRGASFPRGQALYNARGSGGGGGNRTPGGSARFATVETRMRLENVWWLIHPSTKQAVAAYEDPRTGALRELSLPQCIDVWGSELQVDDFHDDVDRKFAQLEDATQDVLVKQQTLTIPKIPKKFIKFASTRRTIHREICNMSGLGFHENVLRLDEALELVQDSKCTTFLVLELAAGGELFDRIKLDCGTDEDTARRYFQQLISGVAFCHASGVCHRDLKPENLLLADNEEVSTLKIADFGLSAIFAMTEQGGGNGADSSLGGQSSSASVQAIRRLRSVVGSPHYVAPEVLMDAGQGYDGAKADAWSIGVIVYAMLAGNLPFGKDLLKCLRYEKFKKWCYNTKYSDEDPVDEVAFPTWFYPAQFSLEVKSLITQLLYPDPTMRLAVEEAQRHAWVLGKRLARRSDYSENPEASPPSSSSILNAPAPGNAASFRELDVPVVTTNAADQDQPQQYQPQHQSVPSPAQHRWTPRSAAMSPGGLNRMPLHARSPTAASMMLSSSSLGVPPSPQKAALRAHLMSSGYMPSVDETAPLSSGQTPVNSPRHSDHERDEVPSAIALQFPMDQATPTHVDAPAKTFEKDECDTTNAIERECQRSPSFTSAELPPANAPLTVETSATSVASPREPNTDSPRRSRRRFTSPPLATGPRSSLLERNNYQHRRNSPPELFLSRFGKGFKFEAIQTAFDEISLDKANLSINLATTPAFRERSSSSAADSGTRTRVTSSSHSVPNTPIAGSAHASASSSSSASSVSTSACPPSYQADLVTRSTRFITTLPAQLVLSKIETILNTSPSPVPTRTAPSEPPQRVTVDWDSYQMEVCYGDVLTCTVQVFLFQRGVYLVEFRRGQVEIFQFKRFYEDIREKLSDGIDLSLDDARLRNAATGDGAAKQDESPRQFLRKRNKSIGVHAELFR